MSPSYARPLMAILATSPPRKKNTSLYGTQRFDALLVLFLNKENIQGHIFAVKNLLLSRLVLLAEVPEIDVPGGCIRDLVVPHDAPGETHQIRLKSPRPQPLHQPSDAGSIFHRHLHARRDIKG